MSHILFVTWDGGGNVPPATALAHELTDRGHAVRFLGHRTQAAPLAAAGFEVAPTQHARTFVAGDRHSPVEMMATFGDRGMGRDLLAEVARHPADLVVIDCLMFGALHAAREAGLPYVVLEHLYDSYYRRGILGGPLGLSLRVRRLAPTRALAGARTRIVTTVPELDPLPGSPGTTQVGPVVTVGPRQVPDRPTILVSLSTYGYPGMTELLQKILEAAADTGAHVVATTGPLIDSGDLMVPEGVEVLGYVPHAELMGQASLFVGHGGHGSTMQALAHDLPLVLVPLSGLADQPVVARSIEAAGAGRTVRRRVSRAELRTVLEELVGPGPHRAAAARLGEAVRARPGATLGADAVESALTDVPRSVR